MKLSRTAVTLGTSIFWYLYYILNNMSIFKQSISIPYKSFRLRPKKPGQLEIEKRTFSGILMGLL